MRIALHASGEPGRRAGLILLGERDLIALGLYGDHGAMGADRRTIKIPTLEGFDLLVTDDAEPTPLAAIAAEDGLHCVAAAEVEASVAGRFASEGLTLLAGANIEGLAATLAAHESARVDAPTAVVAAWTVAGAPLRKGVGVAFPDPVGARWGRRVSTGIEVPVSGRWAAASATVAGVASGKHTERVVGVADERDHLEGLALAAGAVAVAGGAYQPGVGSPADAAAAFLAAAVEAGLGIAAYSV